MSAGVLGFKSNDSLLTLLLHFSDTTDLYQCLSTSSMQNFNADSTSSPGTSEPC
jgi:hypothetical protein